MISYEFGDVLLFSAFPFSNLGESKRRPALVLADTGDRDLIVCRITGESPRNLFDLGLARWKDCGLLIPSSIRIPKMATLGKEIVLKKLGRLGSPDRRKARSILKKLFEL